MYKVTVSKKKVVLFTLLCTQLLNEWSKKVPIAQALNFCEFASKPEQPELSSSIRLKKVFIRTLTKCIFLSPPLNLYGRD